MHRHRAENSARSQSVTLSWGDGWVVPLTTADSETAATIFHVAQRMLALADSAAGIYGDLIWETMGTAELDFSGIYEGVLSTADLVTRLDGSQARYHLLIAELGWQTEGNRGESGLDIDGARRALAAAACAKKLAESAGDSATSAKAAELLSIIEAVMR